MKNEMLNVLIGLQNQGVQLHLTEDGWKEFVRMVEESELSSVAEEQEVV